jgi:type I restriction enzyme, S subunit
MSQEPKNSPPVKGEYAEGGRGLVPQLRFPEFREAGEWEEKKLIDITDKKVKWSFIGGPFGSNLKSSDYVDVGIRIIQLQNIGDAEFVDDYQIFTSEEKADELLSNNIYPGDIILSKMGDPVGRACLIPDIHKRYVMCSDGIRLVVDEKSNSKYFIYSLINSIQFRWLVEKTATGSTRKRIGLDELKNLPMLVPKKKEQHKIADCLSSIDELITAQAQNLDTLKAHKKGLLQQLFPAEGETLPQLRFPEFRDVGEWEAYTLLQVAKFRRGSFPQPYGLPEWYDEFKGMPFIQVFDVDDNLQLKPKTKNKISKLASEQSVFIPQGTVIITIQGSIGRVAITQYDAYIDRTLLLFEEFLKPIEKIFFAYVIQLLFEIERQKAPGGIIKTITKEVLSDFVIRLPDIEEQRKIANCLSSLDELITTQAQKLDMLKAHKIGLMQQLFPALDEVQG